MSSPKGSHIHPVYNWTRVANPMNNPRLSPEDIPKISRPILAAAAESIATSTGTTGCASSKTYRVSHRTQRDKAPRAQRLKSPMYFQIPRLDGGRFSAVDVPDEAVPLSRVLANDLDTLVNGDRPAPLYDASTKLSIRLLFDSCEPYTRQIMASRSTASSEPISVRVLAHKIAEEMAKCLTKTHDVGNSLLHWGRDVELEDLYLWRLVRVSPGSWTK